jgi:hypothetical protein
MTRTHLLHRKKLIFLFLSTSYYSFAQGYQKNQINKANFDLVESYTVTTTTTYTLPFGISPDSIHELKRFDLATKKETRHITKTLDKNGKYLETTVFERPEHIEKWINYPDMQVEDENGVITYGKKGEILSQLEFDQNLKKIKNDKNDKIVKQGKMNDVSFEKLTNAQKNEILKNKGRVTQLTAYAEEIDMDSFLIRNVPEKLIKQEVFLDRSKKMIDSKASKYAVNSEGDYYVDRATSYSWDKRLHKNNATIFIAQTITEKSSNYEIYKDPKYKKVKLRSNGADIWVLDNNPIINGQLGLRYESEELASKNIKLIISDLSGRIVMEKNENEVYNLITQDINQLIAGVYYVRLSSDNKIFDPIKFVKL